MPNWESRFYMPKKLGALKEIYPPLCLLDHCELSFQVSLKLTYVLVTGPNF